MFEALTIVSVIPARGGSKGIPGKNIKYINGHPLIYYTLKNAIYCPFITHAILSSDDDEILEIGQSIEEELQPMGNYKLITLKRPKELADDHSSAEDVMNHASEYYNRLFGSIDIICLMQPTSPLLKLISINKALSHLIYGDKYDSVLTGFRFHGHRWGTTHGGTLISLYMSRQNRQEMTKQWQESGGFYATKMEIFLITGNRISGRTYMEEIPQSEGFELDEFDDLKIIESLLKNEV